MKGSLHKITVVLLLSLLVSGCTFVFQAGRRSDVQKIQELSSQLDELSQAKQLLEGRLGREIQNNQVSLKMMEKGLVITVVGDLLFDSGKAKIRPEADGILNKVAKILKENLPQNRVGIEGYTDNTPIRHSNWKSNWELSSARALSVLHYLVDNEGIAPERLSAIGYGEFNPLSDNDTKSNRQLNRRVEIVIMPQVTKVKDGQSQAQATNLEEPQENLK